MKPLVLIPSLTEARRLQRALTPGCPSEICGIGPVTAALGTARALARHGPRPVLLVGLAGSRDEVRAAPGDVLVGSAVVNEAVGAGDGADFLPLGAMGIDEPLPPDRLELAAPPGLDALPRAVIGTVAAAAGDPLQAAARAQRDPDVLLEEMEGHAVALACRDAGAPLSILRAVSNRCGDRDIARWAFDPACAALGRVLAQVTASDDW